MLQNLPKSKNIDVYKNIYWTPESEIVSSLSWYSITAPMIWSWMMEWLIFMNFSNQGLGCAAIGSEGYHPCQGPSGKKIRNF